MLFRSRSGDGIRLMYVDGCEGNLEEGGGMDGLEVFENVEVA